MQGAFRRMAKITTLFSATYADMLLSTLKIGRKFYPNSVVSTSRLGIRVGSSKFVKRSQKAVHILAKQVVGSRKTDFVRRRATDANLLFFPQCLFKIRHFDRRHCDRRDCAP